MTRILRIPLFAIVVSAIAVPAAAQPPAATNLWTHGTTVNVFTGAGHDASRTSAMFGGAFGWEITPEVGVEASGKWLDRGLGSDAFAADVKLQAGLTGPHAAVPFIEAGVGVFRASFGSGAANVPEFYRHRMMGPAVMIGAGRQVFTDPSFVVGGGVNLYVTRHVAIRPALDATFVRRGGAGQTLTTISVHVAYHFEPHPLISRK